MIKFLIKTFICEGNEIHELLLELTDAEGETRYAQYSAFSVASESEQFSLNVLGGYEGDAGDALMYHAGSRFSTKDKDNDAWLEGSCAQSHGKNRKSFLDEIPIWYIIDHF